MAARLELRRVSIIVGKISKIEIILLRNQVVSFLV
jgi:hypothetical protein